MARLNKLSRPPGGFRYLVPETGKMVEGGYISWGEFLVRIQGYYVSNMIPCPPTLPTLIETYLCSKYPQVCDEVPASQQTHVGVGIMFEAARVGTATLFDWWKNSGRKKVDASLANSRAAVCVGCPMNQTVSCSGCMLSALQKVSELIVGRSKTSHDNELKTCAVCLCGLRAKVWMEHDVIYRHLTERQKAALPHFCWLNTERYPGDKN